MALPNMDAIGKMGLFGPKSLCIMISGVHLEENSVHYWAVLLNISVTLFGGLVTT